MYSNKNKHCNREIVLFKFCLL